MCYNQFVVLTTLTFVSVILASFDVVSTTSAPSSVASNNCVLKTLELKLDYFIEQIGSKLQSKKHFLQNSPFPLDPLARYAKDCKGYKDSGAQMNGLYRIQPDPSIEPFLVTCDMEAAGGGWTYLMNRYDGSQNFDLEWSEYKNGFGNLNGEFWLGLEKIRHLTESTQVSELLVELVDWDNKKVYARYGYFKLGSENEGYSLKVSDYSGNAGDSLIFQNGQKFTTKDKDQDISNATNCAIGHSGGWWYTACFRCKLTGKYLTVQPTESFLGIHWHDFHTIKYSLKQARMMIRSRKLWN